MKKFLVLTAAALIFAGCSDFIEQDALPTTDVNAPETIHASFENVAEESRTYLDEGRYMRWTKDDEISYFPGITFNMQYRFAGSTGERNGSFNKLTFDPVTGADLNCNYAVYPYAEETSISTNGVISFNLPATQHYAENSFGLGANTMVAATRSIDDSKILFKNACGYLKLQLYGEDTTIKSIEFRGNNNEKIAGAATITAYYDSNPTVSMTESATTSITLDCVDGVKLSSDEANPTAFWLVIPEQTFEKGFTITVTDTNGGKFEKATQNSVAITRNTIHPMKAAKAECKVSVPKPANNEIWYTNGSTTEATTPHKTDVFGANIVSNLYDVDKECWVITFDGDVTMIGEEAFYGYNTDCKNITSIAIPDSVTLIRYGAFWGCTSLTSVTIPDSVTSIGVAAFRGCTSLISITIPDSVTSIGSSAFYSCTSLTSVTIPDSVTKIESYAFYHCESLKAFYGKFASEDNRCLIVNGTLNAFAIGCGATSYTIPDSVTSIGEWAFGFCTSLTSVTIPDSVTKIESYAFANCKSLTSVTIPNSVTSIGEHAFSCCDSLTSVTIGNGVTSIGEQAFSYCTSLTSVTIGNGVTSIRSGAFYNCISLTNITIPDSVTSIGVAAFRGCTSLISVTIPNRVTSIESSAFRDCTSLTSVTIPNSVTSIGNYAFHYCTSLTSVTIPNSVTSIGIYAFYHCESLTSITIPDSVTEIGYYAFYYCTSLTSVTIPNGVTKIGGCAFSGCTSLKAFYGKFATTDNRCLIVNGTLNAFAIGCGATSYTIPNSITKIGRDAFSYCTSLTSVNIPDSVTEFGNTAFRDCTSLKTVYCKPTTPPTGGSSMFSNNASDRKIYVPASADDSIINAYKAKQYWSDYASYIEEYDFSAQQ